MGVWPQYGVPPWRRTHHMYLLYTIYLVITTRPCRASSANRPANPMYKLYMCQSVCEIPDFQQACMTKKDCNEKLYCGSGSKCMLQCSYKHFNTAATLSMTAECDNDDSLEERTNVVKCDTRNGPSLQFEHDISNFWLGFVAKRQFEITCYPVATMCPSTAQCCSDPMVWNCTIVAAATPTTTSTATSETTRTSTGSTTTPSFSANRTTPPSPSTARTISPSPSTARTISPSPSTARTISPSPSTARTISPSPSTARTTLPSTSEKRTSTLKTSTKGSQSPLVSSSTTSTQTVTEGGSTDRQTDSNPVPTIAVAVGSMLVLSIVVISIIVIIVLRRNRRRKKAENPVFIVNNTAYGAVTKHPENNPDPDNPTSLIKIPAKPEADEEHSYCYASFDDSQPAVHPEGQAAQDSNHMVTSLDDSYFVLEKESQEHGDSSRIEQSNVLEHLGGKETARSENKLDKPSNYFVLEKLEPVYDTKRPETDVSSNYFVLETTSREHDVQRSHEEEITDTDGTCSGNADDNYFLVGTTADDRQTPAVFSEHSATEHQDHISNGNYFVLEKPTDDLEVVTHNATDLSPRIQNSRNIETRANPRTNGMPTPTHDPYDHVRIGHVHTNGYDDGVYDELRKQHVRYDTEDVGNDYDHC